MEETKTAAETGTLQVSEKPEKQNKKRLPWGAFLGIWAGAMLLLFRFPGCPDFCQAQPYSVIPYSFSASSTILRTYAA